MPKKVTRCILWTALLVLPSCTQPTGTATEIITVRVSTGLPEMTFKELGEALMSAYARVLPDVRFVIVETAGSVRNLEELRDGSTDLGLALADVAYRAYNGELGEGFEPIRSVRGLAVLHHSRVHVLVRRDSKIQSIADLGNRATAVGPIGSGTAVTSEMLLRAFNIPVELVHRRPMSFSDAATALARGEIESAFVVSADPVDTVRRAIEAGARLLPVDGSIVRHLRAEYPFFRSSVIPGGIYPGHPDAIPTVGIDVLLLCRGDLDDGLVRRLTRALFEVLPDLSAQFDYLRLMDIGRAPATPIPLHPGAALYYRQEELSR